MLNQATHRVGKNLATCLNGKVDRTLLSTRHPVQAQPSTINLKAERTALGFKRLVEFGYLRYLYEDLPPVPGFALNLCPHWYLTD